MKPLLLWLTLAAGCSSPRLLDAVDRGPKPDQRRLHLSGDAPRSVEANWKERRTQPYVFVVHRGDYRDIGDSMRVLLDAAENLGLQSSGAPFALFFDDPGRVPVEDLRARACLPVQEAPARTHPPLEFDVLPRAMVVYARVQGAYPQVARVYPLLFSYLRDLGWRQGGPVREVYLANPVEAASDADLLTEVQIPWVAATP